MAVRKMIYVEGGCIKLNSTVQVFKERTEEKGRNKSVGQIK